MPTWSAAYTMNEHNFVRLLLPARWTDKHIGINPLRAILEYNRFYQQLK